MKRKYEIYQIGRHSQFRDKKFLSLDDNIDTISLEEFGYEQVYNEEINCADNDCIVLEKIFIKFNIGERPINFKGHSLSVSDIVIIDGRSYYCQSMGWKEINIK